MKKLYSRLLIRFIFIALAVLFSSCAGGLSKRESARVYYNLGNAYFELGKTDDASSAYLRALDFDKKLISASFNLARTYIEAGKYSEALKLLDSMLEEDDKNTVLHASKAYCLYRYGDYEKAAESYLNVININPADPDALFNYALIMTSLGNYEIAAGKLFELKKINPDDSLLISKIDFAEGRVYYLQEKYDKSLECFEAVYKKDPEYEGVKLYLFDIYKKKKYYGKMVNIGEEILEKDKNNKEILFEISRVLLIEIEDMEEGLVYLKKAVDKGFKDKKKIEEILENKNITVKKDIEKILENLSD